MNGTCHMNELPVPSEVVGYIVLTSKDDGTWAPDWDGVLHTDVEAAVGELRAAAGPSGEHAILVECVRVTD